MRFLYAVMLFSAVEVLQGVHAKNEGIEDLDSIRSVNIDEIVVTSSKETNSLKTFPGAVSMITPQQISGQQIYSLKDIGASVPNLYMPDYGSRLTSAIYIRGIGARSSGQSIGLYVDDVPFLDKSTFDFELTDIKQIEVLRGPQGTLYGRNAMGGLIKVYTISPFEFQGKRISLSGGNYGNIRAKASHYGLLNDKIGFTAGVYYTHSNGYFTNEYNGEKADKENSVGGRLKFEGHFSPSFSASYTVAADYTDQGAFPYGLYDPATGKVAPVNLNDSSAYRRLMVNNHLKMEYKHDRFYLNSTTGYQYFDDDMHMDQDYSPRSVFILNQLQKQHAVSQELSLRSNSESNYQWSVGAYGFYSALNTEGPVTFKEDGIKDIFQNIFDNLKEANPKMPHITVTDKQLYIPGSFQTPSFGVALFHQSTYNNLFVEGLSLTAGLRFDYEKQKFAYQSNGKMHLSMSFKPGMPPMDISSMYDESVVDLHTSQDFCQLLPKVSLKYEWSPSTFTYISASKGYKTGGYNVQMSADVMQSQMKYDTMSKFAAMIPGGVNKPASIEETAAFDPEQSWSYELGIRSSGLDNRLSGELTLFYMDIDDLQLTKFVDSGNGRILTNAGKAESYGLEASLRAELAEGLTMDANYGYTHATFKDYNNGKVNYKGNYIPYAPQHTFNLGLQYNRLFRNSFIDQFTIASQLNGTGKVYWTEKNDIQQNFYMTLNAKAGIRKGCVSFNVWSKNITDTRYSAFYFESRNQPFIQTGKPFQIGAEIAVSL